MLNIGPAALAQEDKPMKKLEYNFKQQATPDALIPNQSSVGVQIGNKAYNTQGHFLAEYGQKILDFEFNPSTINFLLISAEKKQNKAAIYSMFDENTQIKEFKNKKLGGNPTAAVFTPDARQILIAANGNLDILDSRTFEVIEQQPIDIRPTSMIMSGNAYFIAMVDSTNILVYNFPERNVRHKIKGDDIVADIVFNNDNTEMAVLTESGDLTIYDTRTFMPKKSIEDLDGGCAAAYNADGKYLAVATSPEHIQIINLLNTLDRQDLNIENGAVNSLYFLADTDQDALLTYPVLNAVQAKRMTQLSPYYGKLISEEANERLNEWLKMMPGETMEQYQARVTDESRRKQLQLYEDELSTQYAGDLLSMATVSLGKYDRANQLLEVDFDNMPSIYLPVPETSLGAFNDASSLVFTNAKYGVMGDDNFELIYAVVQNTANGETYIYDNVDRVPLSFMEGDENVVSIEVIQQQQMEELRLQEIKAAVIEEAKNQSVISEHTHIDVDSRVDSDYDSNGNKILNYVVKFTYEVEPEFTVHEDFAPGKYHVDESGAATSMLKIVKEAFEGDFSRYVQDGKKLVVKISGTADATPIVNKIKYDGSYGEFIDEPVYQDGKLSAITVTSSEPVTQNEQLAFLRASGVRDYLQTNVANLNNMNADYQYYISVSQDKGSQFRRITTEFIFIDAL